VKYFDRWFIMFDEIMKQTNCVRNVRRCPFRRNHHSSILLWWFFSSSFFRSSLMDIHSIGL
jgi:hypothetical protein